jgi:putative oxidoreductase
MDLRRAVPRTFDQAADNRLALGGATGLDAGILLLRLIVGLTMAAHGAQKLFGWFGGPGFSAMAHAMEEIGFHPGGFHAALSGGAELGGGLLLALGLLTPLGAAAVAGAMIAAIATVTGQNGFISPKGGYEYNLVLIASALAVAFIGPGRFSLDKVLGWRLSGWRWGVGAAVLAAVTAAGVVAVRR